MRRVALLTLVSFSLWASASFTPPPPNPGGLGYVAWSSNGRYLAFGGSVVYVVDTTQSSLKRVEIGAGGMAGMAFASSGEELFTLWRDRRLRVFDPASGAIRRTIELPSPCSPTALAVYQNGEFTGVGCARGDLILVDRNGIVLKSWMGHVYGVSALTFDEKGSTLFSGASDQFLKAWKVPEGTLARVFDAHIVDDLGFKRGQRAHMGRIASLAVRDGFVLSGAFWHGGANLSGGRSDLVWKDGTLRLWSSSDGSPQKDRVLDFRVWRMEFFGKEAAFLLHGERGTSGNLLSRLSLRNWDVQAHFRDPDGVGLTALGVQETRGLIAVGNENGRLFLIDALDHRQLGTLQPTANGWALWTPQGRFDGIGPEIPAKGRQPNLLATLLRRSP